MRAAVLLAVAMLAGSPAIAAIPSERTAGVWDGTVGTLPVRACFVSKSFGDHGAYYYRSKLVAIPLNADDKRPGEFTENWADQKGPRWTISGITNGVMTGRWTSGGKSLPVRLTSVPVKLSEDETACGSDAFFRPRMAGVRTVRSRAMMDGTGIARLALDHRGHFPGVAVRSFQIDGSDAATKRINKRLRQPFEDGESSWLTCLKMSFNNLSFEGESVDKIEPRLINKRYLSAVESIGYFCGGAHPEDAIVPLLFDRTTGAVVDPFTFVANRKALFAEILSRFPSKDRECEGVIREADDWTAEVTRSGIIFRPQLPRVIMACGDDIAIPFTRLRPWLNAKGKAAVATIEKR